MALFVREPYGPSRRDPISTLFHIRDSGTDEAGKDPHNQEMATAGQRKQGSSLVGGSESISSNLFGTPIQNQ